MTIGKTVVGETSKQWDSATVHRWLKSRIVAARADQVAAERYGRERQDDCDKAAAEEMVCMMFKAKEAVSDQGAFYSDLKALLDRDEFIWRGVYNDLRFDRHARSYIRKLMKMAKLNQGFEKTGRYQ